MIKGPNRERLPYPIVWGLFSVFVGSSFRLFLRTVTTVVVVVTTVVVVLVIVIVLVVVAAVVF